MTYNPNGNNAFEERKALVPGTITDAVIIEIEVGKVKDFVKGKDEAAKKEALKKFKRPEDDAIQVISEGKYEGKIYRCETLFSYEKNPATNKIVLDPKSNLESFRKLYDDLPKRQQMVKHVVATNGYFKLRVKV